MDQYLLDNLLADGIHKSRGLARSVARYLNIAAVQPHGASWLRITGWLLLTIGLGIISFWLLVLVSTH